MMRRFLAGCAILVLAVPCFGGGKDKEFRTVVKTVEARYGVHHMGIPLLGLATFCMRVGHVPGAAGLKMAVFDNLPNSDVAANEALQNDVQAALGSSWHPFVRARSRADGNVTVIYARADEKQMEVLIVNADGNDAVILQANLKTEQVRKWLSDPQGVVEGNNHDAVQVAVSGSDEK